MSVLNISSDPTLPPELELKIVKHYFDEVKGDLDKICLLMRAAERFHEWLLPLIEPQLRTTMLPRGTEPKQLGFKHPGIGNEGIVEVSEVIQHLYIGQPRKIPFDIQDLVAILRLCHGNLENLAVWDEQRNPTCLHNIIPSDVEFPKLKKLSGMINNVSLIHQQLRTKSGFGRVLQNITHLDLILPFGELAKLPDLLKDCHNLTHLSIESESLSSDVLDRLLEGCKKLTVLIVWCSSRSHPNVNKDSFEEKLRVDISRMRGEYHKVVMISNVHAPRYSSAVWSQGAAGTKDVWADAEVLQEARKMLTVLFPHLRWVS